MSAVRPPGGGYCPQRIEQLFSIVFKWVKDIFSGSLFTTPSRTCSKLSSHPRRTSYWHQWLAYPSCFHVQWAMSMVHKTRSNIIIRHRRTKGMYLHIIWQYPQKQEAVDPLEPKFWKWNQYCLVQKSINKEWSERYTGPTRRVAWDKQKRLGQRGTTVGSRHCTSSHMFCNAVNIPTYGGQTFKSNEGCKIWK